MQYLTDVESEVTSRLLPAAAARFKQCPNLTNASLWFEDSVTLKAQAVNALEQLWKVKGVISLLVLLSKNQYDILRELFRSPSAFQNVSDLEIGTMSSVTYLAFD